MEVTNDHKHHGNTPHHVKEVQQNSSDSTKWCQLLFERAAYYVTSDEGITLIGTQFRTTENYFNQMCQKYLLWAILLI